MASIHADRTYAERGRPFVAWGLGAFAGATAAVSLAAVRSGSRHLVSAFNALRTTEHVRDDRVRRVVLLIVLIGLLVTACRSSMPAPLPSPSLASAPPASRPLSSGQMLARSGAAASSVCGGPLQAMVDAAAPGSVVSVPACVYRETVTVTKPLTLAAEPGAEIRGSDVWADWTRRGRYWTNLGAPAFYGHGECRKGVKRCLWPQQVFVDGWPLQQVVSDPSSGQFSFSDGWISLADDPTGRTVEVTMRSAWIEGKSDDVTIQSFTMAHAGNSAQRGGIMNNGHSRWTIQDNVLWDAHGQSVHLRGGFGHRVVANDIGWAGQLGVGLSEGATDVLIQGNRIHHNNTEDFEPGWEAGGLKALGAIRLTLDGNEVHENLGTGLWCDGDCNGAVFSGNRVYHNTNVGLHFEISDGASISGNAVWENGWDYDEWGWGAGILISTSKNVEVFHNVVAWNADGISVIEQGRGRGRSATNVGVYDNVIAVTNQPPRYGLAWLSDYRPHRLYDSGSNNRGERNAYWFSEPERGDTRFSWKDEHTRLDDFKRTPGGRDDRYLSDAEKEQLLATASVPVSPVAR